MGYLLAVQGGGNHEVGRLGEHALSDVLVEGHADLVARVQHAVARVGVAEELRLLHVLHDGDGLTLLRNLLVAVGRGRLCAELIGAVDVVLHRELHVDDAAGGQRLVVGGSPLGVNVILLSGNRRPCGVAKSLVLYADILQVLELGVVVAHLQVQHVAHDGVQHALVGRQGDVRAARYEVGSQVDCRLQVALAGALQRQADVLVVVDVGVHLLQRQRDGQRLAALHDEGVAVAKRACRKAQQRAVGVGALDGHEVELPVAVGLALILQLQVEDGLSAARHVAQHVLRVEHRQLRVFHLHRGRADAGAGPEVLRHRLALIGTGCLSAACDEDWCELLGRVEGVDRQGIVALLFERECEGLALRLVLLVHVGHSRAGFCLVGHFHTRLVDCDSRLAAGHEVYAP